MKICDKCGSTINDSINPLIQMQQVSFPYYYIDITCVNSLYYKTKIDLCDKCVNKVINFIREKENE